jgi:hypothetical protein
VFQVETATAHPGSLERAPIRLVYAEKAANTLDGGDGRDSYVFDAGFGSNRIADSGNGGNNAGNALDTSSPALPGSMRWRVERATTPSLAWRATIPWTAAAAQT